MYKRLKLLRQEFNYSKKQIATYLKIKPCTYSKIESGKKDIKISELILLSNLYNTSIDYILNETNQKEKH